MGVAGIGPGAQSYGVVGIYCFGDYKLDTRLRRLSLRPSSVPKPVWRTLRRCDG